MVIKRVKATELIFDWNLWPRHSATKLDGTNITQLKAAIEAGAAIPPPVVGADMRIVDGFHRVKAYMSLYGNDAEIDVEVRRYKSDAAMFFDSVTLNARQGMTLTPQDRAHAFLKAKKFGLPLDDIARALNMEPERLQAFVATRTAIDKTGNTIAIPGGAKHLAGKVLDESEERFVRTSSGIPVLQYINMLINALKAHALPLTEQTENRLTILRELIDDLLAQEAA